MTIRKYVHFAVSITAILMLSACSKSVEYNVVPVFEPYVQRFIEDGAKRGIAIDFTETGLSIIFREAVSKESGGVCKGDHNIEIEKFYWDGLTDIEKEGLIYHELGHCHLSRPHRNDKLPNGEWASRMRGDPIPEGDNAVINYSGSRRAYYIDELFDPATAFPSWASLTQDYNKVDPNAKQLLFEISDTSQFEKNIFGLVDGDFEINFSLTTGTSEGFVGMQVLGSSNDDRIRIAYNRDGAFIIDSGARVWGLMYYREDYPLLKSGTNKLTLRHQGDKYFVFVNEQFSYWFDYTSPNNSSVSSLNAGRLGMPLFKKVEVFKL